MGVRLAIYQNPQEVYSLKMTALLGGTLLTYSPERRRLYLHLLDYPMQLPLEIAFADKVAYAQFLSDGSEILLKDGALRLPAAPPA